MANMASACALVLSNDKALNPLRTWRSRAAASTCLLVSVSVVCICVLVVCGVFVVREYSLAVGYVATSCLVNNVTYGAPAQCQHCPGHRDKSKEKPGGGGGGGGGGAGGGCVQSSFPCVQILVGYSVNWVAHEALLHSDSIDAAGIHSQCSYHVHCHKDPEENRKLVEAYALQWQHPSKRGDHFTCFYNTANFNDVIITKRYSKYDVMHCMLWPSLVLVTCCVVFLYLETRRRKLTFCGRRGTESESSAERRYTPEVSDARLLDSHVFIRRNFIENGVLEDGRIICKLGSGVMAEVIPGKQWKSYSSLEKLVTRKDDLSRSFPPAIQRLDSKSRSFDRLDETRRLQSKLKVDLENDRLRRAAEVTQSNPHGLESIGLSQQQQKQQQKQQQQQQMKRDESSKEPIDTA